jgi:hypothetical protein
VDDSWGFALT